MAIKSFRSLLHMLFLSQLALAPVYCWAENLKVAVVLSDNSAPYLSFADALGKNLPVGVQATVLEHPDQLSIDKSRADLIIAVGLNATELAARQSSVPVLAVMVSRTGYDELLAQVTHQKNPKHISAIYLDQPWGRQLDFLHAAFPGKLRIGLLYTLDARIAGLHGEISRRGDSLVSRPVHSSSELFTQLEAVLVASDVLLAIPDSALYNSSNIRNILLTSYRLNIPLIGISKAYVNAGALSAIFSTPEQLAEQARATVSAFSQTRRLPEPQYPSDFTIEINAHVARSLKIELPSREAILSQMDKIRVHKR